MSFCFFIECMVSSGFSSTGTGPQCECSTDGGSGCCNWCWCGRCLYGTDSSLWESHSWCSWFIVGGRHFRWGCLFSHLYKCCSSSWQVRQIHGNLEEWPYSLRVRFFLKRKRSVLCNHCVVCFHFTAYFTFWADCCIFTNLSVNVMPLEDTLIPHFLGTFTKSWEVPISLIISLHSSVCPTVSTKPQLDVFMWNLPLANCIKICNENPNLMKIGKTYRYFTWLYLKIKIAWQIDKC